MTSRYLNAGTQAVTDEPVKLVPNTSSQSPRTWLHLVNTGAQTIFIVDEAATDSANGYPIPVQNLANGVTGEKIIEDHAGEVFVCCAAGQSSTLKWMEQRR